MEAGALLRLGLDQEELCFFLSHACLYVPRALKGFLAVPPQSNAPGVIVLHAWWGLNPFFKSLCDRLATEGFVAFAPDLNEGRVAETVDEAKEIMSGLDGQRKYAVAMAAIDFLRGRSEVQKEPFSLIGFSM